MTADEIATQMVKNSTGIVSEKQKKTVGKQYIRNFRNSQPVSNIATPYSTDEIDEAISNVECGKAPGSDNLFPDYIKHFGMNARKWITKFFNNIKLSGKIPRSWKKARVIAVLKPNKSPIEITSYRPISLLSC